MKKIAAVFFILVMPVHERLRVISGVRQVLAGRNTDQETAFSVVTTLFL